MKNEKQLIRYLLLILLSGALTSQIQAANWSQWNESTTSGISQGYWKLAFASYFQPEVGDTDAPQAVGLGGQFESLVSDNWGIGLQGYGQTYSASDKLSAASFLFSFKYHFFDRSPLNLFVGSLAGVHLLDVGDSRTQAGESIGVTAGISYYFWGSFFSELQTDYVSYGYQNGRDSMELPSVRAHLVLGVMY